MRITIEVSEDRECTDSPWWVIVDPQQNMRRNVDLAAACIEGPFFSRQEAEDELRTTHYNYSKRACVYCMSGYHTRQYKAAWRKFDERLIDRKVFWFKVMPYKLWTWLRTAAICGTVFLVSVPANAHLGPDEGLHHFIDQLLSVMPWALAAVGATWAKLRR